MGLAVATGLTGIGAVAGGAVALNGLDQIQAGARQLLSGGQVDSLTSQGLQAAGLSRQAANLTDAGIGVVGSLGAGAATAAIKVSAVSAADPAAKGLSALQILAGIEKGSQALNNADFAALGGGATSALAKAAMIEASVDATGNAYKLTTTMAERFLLKAPSLAGTGLTPAADAAVGAGGSLGIGSAAAPCVRSASTCK